MFALDKLCDDGRLRRDFSMYRVSEIPREVQVYISRQKSMCVYLDADNQIRIRIIQNGMGRYAIELDAFELYQFVKLIMDKHGYRSDKEHIIGNKFSLRYKGPFLVKLYRGKHISTWPMLYLRDSLMRALELMYFRKVRLQPLTLKDLCRRCINLSRLDTSRLPKKLAQFCQEKHVLSGDLSLDRPYRTEYMELVDFIRERFPVPMFA